MTTIDITAAPYNAVADLKRATGVSTTASSTTVTRTGGDAFTSTAVDAGKVIIVPGAGAAGVDLVTTISTVTDATHAVVATAASTAVASKVAFYGTDATAAVQSAQAALPAVGGTLLFPGAFLMNGEFSSLSGKKTVSLVGTNGHAGASFTATSGFNQELAPSTVLYVKSGAATFINATQTRGFVIDNLDVRFANAAYTGTLVDLTGSSATSDSRTVWPLLTDLTIGAAIDGLVGPVLVADTYAWQPTYRRVTFVGGDIQVLCANGASNFVNGRLFDGSSWGLYGTVGIRNPGEGCKINGGLAERNWNVTTASRVGKLIDSGDGTVIFDGCSIDGVWFSDVNSAASAAAWIVARPGVVVSPGSGGLAVNGARGGGGTNQTLVRVDDNWFRGVTIRGVSASFNGKLLDCNSKTNVTGVVESNGVAQGSGLTLVANAAGSGTSITTT